MIEQFALFLCSESCLGGLQESKIICVDVKDNPVSPMHCNMAERPEVIVRTCNDHPCPPRYYLVFATPGIKHEDPIMGTEGGLIENRKII